MTVPPIALARLRKLRLEIGLDCALRCRHCSAFAAPGHPAGFPADRARGLVEEFAALGGEELTLTGGEPFAYDLSRELLALAKARGLRTAVFSSGVLRDHAGIHSIPTSLLTEAAATLDRVVVTLYAARPAAHEAITTVAGSHALALESIARSLVAGVCTEIHFVPMHGAIDELPMIYSIAASMGVAGIRVIRFVRHGRASAEGGLRPSPDELRRLAAAVEELRGDGRVEMHVGSAFGFLVQFAPHCTAGVEEIVVSWDGTIYPCSGFAGYRGPEAIGNALDTPLAEVWEHAPFLTAMRALIGARINGGGCEVGCPAQKAAIAGSIRDDVRDPDALDDLLPEDAGPIA